MSKGIEDRISGPRLHPLLVLGAIVALSLLVAAVLFGTLSSTGIFRSRYSEFGGAAAGFFLTLYLLHRWYDQMEQRYANYSDMEAHVQNLERKAGVAKTFTLTLYLMSEGDALSPEHGPYRIAGYIYSLRSGDEREVPLQPRWENGALTVDFRNLNSDDLVRACVRDAHNLSWEFDYFHPLRQRKDLAAVRQAGSIGT